MKPIRLIASVLLVLAAAVPLSASDPIAVYARIDRVVLEPNAEAPDAVQLWGVFALAAPDNPNYYRPAARGYLYFKAPADKSLALKEWSDLKSVAGTGDVVSFGSRWSMHPRLRTKDEKPSEPDAYSTNIGLTRARRDTQYAPVRDILDFRQ